MGRDRSVEPHEASLHGAPCVGCAEPLIFGSSEGVGEAVALCPACLQRARVRELKTEAAYFLAGAERVQAVVDSLGEQLTEPARRELGAVATQLDTAGELLQAHARARSNPYAR